MPAESGFVCYNATAFFYDISLSWQSVGLRITLDMAAIKSRLTDQSVIAIFWSFHEGQGSFFPARRQLGGKGGCVGVLGSPVARRIGLFDNALGARGLTVIWPDHDDALLAAIKIIKSHGPSTTARETLLAASVLLGRKGADLQFIACSEFSLIADSVAPGVTAVDTLDLLTREIVSFATAA